MGSCTPQQHDVFEKSVDGGSGLNIAALDITLGLPIVCLVEGKISRTRYVFSSSRKSQKMLDHVIYHLKSCQSRAAQAQARRNVSASQTTAADL